MHFHSFSGILNLPLSVIILFYKLQRGIFVLNCIYCNQPVGFFQIYHQDCYQKLQKTKSCIDSIISNDKNTISNATNTKSSILELITADPVYSTYLLNSAMQLTHVIKPNELGIYSEDLLTIVQYKNHCTMTRTGCSYRRYPVWKECYQLLSKTANLLLTNKAIYIFLENKKTLRFTYTNVDDLSYDAKAITLTLEIKTTSESPHQIHLTASDKRDISKIQNLYYLLKCFC